MVSSDILRIVSVWTDPILWLVGYEVDPSSLRPVCSEVFPVATVNSPYLRLVILCSSCSSCFRFNSSSFAL